MRAREARASAALLEQARGAVARAKAFRARHPKLARQERQEAVSGVKKPIAPILPYASYVKANLRRIRSEQPNLQPQQAMAECARQFKALAPEEQAQINADYQTKLVDYHKALAKFNDAQPPKKPLGPYIVSTYDTHTAGVPASPTACAC